MDKLKETLLSTAYDTTRYAFKTSWLMQKKPNDTVRATAAMYIKCTRFAALTDSVEETLKKISMLQLSQQVQAHWRRC